jgi:hypothetical protein
MLKKLLQGRPKPDAAVMRKAKPLRNPTIQYEILPDGTALLEAPLQEQKGLAGALARKMKAPHTKKFELEAVGAFVWELCDGAHTFEGITKKLRERFKMNRLEAEAALAAFLQMLTRKGLLVIADKT